LTVFYLLFSVVFRVFLKESSSQNQNLAGTNIQEIYLKLTNCLSLMNDVLLKSYILQHHHQTLLNIYVALFKIWKKLFAENAEEDVSIYFETFIKKALAAPGNNFLVIEDFLILILQENLIHIKLIEDLRSDNFAQVLSEGVFSLNQMGDYAIIAFENIQPDENQIMQVEILQKSLTKALVNFSNEAFFDEKIFRFYQNILDFYEKELDTENFFEVVCYIINGNNENNLKNALLTIEFWHHNFSRLNYLPSIISFLLTKRSREKDAIIKIFEERTIFCMNAIEFILNAETFKEIVQTNALIQKLLFSKLTCVFNSLETLKLKLLQEFLNPRYIFAKLVDCPEIIATEKIFEKVEDGEEDDLIPKLLENQIKLAKILQSQDKSNHPNNVIHNQDLIPRISVKNKFYHLMYTILKQKVCKDSVNSDLMKQNFQNYFDSIEENKFILSDLNILGKVQSSMNFLSQVLYLESKRTRDVGILDVVELVLDAISKFFLFDMFEKSSIKFISKNILISVKNFQKESSEKIIELLAKLRREIFAILGDNIQSKRIQVIELYSLLAQVELDMLRYGNFNKQIFLRINNLKFKKSAIKPLIKARIRLLTYLSGKKSATNEEISNLYSLIENDICEIIEKTQDFKAIKYQILWFEVLYIFACHKKGLQNKDIDKKIFEQVVWKLCTQFEFSQNFSIEDVRSLKEEQILLKVLQDGICKKIKDFAPVISPDKHLKFHLMIADLYRKRVYLLIDQEFQKNHQNLRIEETAKQVSLILSEFRNCIDAFSKMLKIEAPERDFGDFMNNWMKEKSYVRDSIRKVLNDIKFADAMKILNLLSSSVEIAEYFCLSDELEDCLKRMMMYLMCFANELNKGLEKEITLLFNTRTQLILAILQIKLAIIYEKKSNYKSSEQCYKNFLTCYKKDSVEKIFRFLQKDARYQTIFIELEGLRIHLESLIYKYQIQINQPGTFQNLRQFLLKLDKIKFSDAFIFLKVNLLLYSSQILYSSGHAAYSIQEIRKCLDYLINYGFNYNQSQGIDQILAKQIDAKPDRFARVCLLDLKYLNETNQLTKELLKPAGSSSLEVGSSMNTVTNMLNTLFAKNLALNYSKLSMLSLIIKSLKKLIKILENIGLFNYSKFYENILKDYSLKTSQILPYLKIMTKENIKNGGVDAESLLHRDDQLVEKMVNEVICVINNPPDENFHLDRQIDQNQKFFEVYQKLSNSSYVDSYWKSNLIKFLNSLMQFCSDDIPPNLFVDMTNQKNLTINICTCEIFKSFLKTGRFSLVKLLDQTWYQQKHFISKKKSLEFWNYFLELVELNLKTFIEMERNNLSLEKLIWLLNCSQMIKHLILKNSLLNFSLMKKALILKRHLDVLVEEQLETEPFFLQELYRLSKLECCCENKIGIESESRITGLGDSLAQEIDFWILFSDIRFTYKSQIKSGDIFMKSNKEHIQKSQEDLNLPPDFPFLSTIQDFSEIKISDFFAVTEKTLKFLGNSPILILQWFQNQAHKILFIAKIYANSQKNICFFIDNFRNSNLLNFELKEFQNLILESEKSLKEIKKAEVDDPQDEKRIFELFEERVRLDQRMKTVLEAFENSFGFYKGIFLSEFTDEGFNQKVDSIYQKLKEQLLQFLHGKLKIGPDMNLEKDLQREASRLIEIVKGVSVFSLQERSLERDFLLSLEEIFQNSLCLKIINEFQRQELKIFALECRSEISKYCEGRNLKRKPAFLLLDENFQSLPFECLPIFLAHNQAFLRIPSLQYLQNLQHEENLVNFRDTFYVLNPSKEMQQTQERFQNFFKQQQTWEGVIGSEPHKQVLKEKLAKQGCYLYIGNGAGESILDEDDIQDIQKIKSAIFLIGSSSCKQIHSQDSESKGERELSGVCIEYLLCNCPFFVGLLWDVARKDLDLMTHHILQSMTTETTQNTAIDFFALLQKAKKPL